MTEIKLYNGEVLLQFDPVKHKYSRVCPETGKSIKIPGVSTICKILDKPQLVPWAAKKVAEKMLRIIPTVNDGEHEYIESMWFEEFQELVESAKKAPREILEDAGDVGTQAHAIIENLIKTAIEKNGGIVGPGIKVGCEEIYDKRVLACVDAAYAWMKDHKVRWLATEQFIYSRKYDYAGIMDGLAEVDGVMSVIDFKTGNGIYFEFLMQISAYLEAYLEMAGISRIKNSWLLRLGKEAGDFFYLHVPDDPSHFEGFKHCLELTKIVKEGTKFLSVAEKEAKIRKAETADSKSDWLSEIK